MSLNILSGTSDVRTEFLRYIQMIAGDLQKRANEVRGTLESFSENQLIHCIDSLQSYRIQLPFLTELLGNHVQPPVPLEGNESREEIEAKISLELKIISAYSGMISTNENPFQGSIPRDALTNLMCIDYEVADMHMRSIRNTVDNISNTLHNRAIRTLQE